MRFSDNAIGSLVKVRVNLSFLRFLGYRRLWSDSTYCYTSAIVSNHIRTRSSIGARTTSQATGFTIDRSKIEPEIVITSGISPSEYKFVLQDHCETSCISIAPSVTFCCVPLTWSTWSRQVGHTVGVAQNQLVRSGQKVVCCMLILATRLQLLYVMFLPTPTGDSHSI